MSTTSPTWQNLPRSGATIVREGQSLEFKETYNPADRAEMAKDVALLANMTGGLLIIGARETTSGVEYPGLSLNFAQKVRESFQQAVRAFCSPRPIFAIHEILNPNDAECVVLAVIVEAYPDQPIGAAAPDQGRNPTDAWRFPVRVGSHTKYLQAEQLMLWTNPATRRTAILLSALPLNKSLRVICESGHPNNSRSCSFDADLRGWSIERNFVELGAAGAPGIFRTPLEDVAAVWQALHGIWTIRLKGRISEGSGGSLEYFPKP